MEFGGATNNNGEIKWELRPGGMLVQRRETAAESSAGEVLITVRVSAVSHCHDISIEATSTFGNEALLSLSPLSMCIYAQNYEEIKRLKNDIVNGDWHGDKRAEAALQRETERGW
ncbi:hypothetical protein GBA52_011812 [Prunus armeniaca]|nr:hypothetical protein GBA52_011812 [Prunus armeniaca]